MRKKREKFRKHRKRNEIGNTWKINKSNLKEELEITTRVKIYFLKNPTKQKKTHHETNEEFDEGYMMIVGSERRRRWGDWWGGEWEQ